MDTLPSELYKKIASFLNRQNAMEWGFTCRHLRQTLCLSSFVWSSVPLVLNATWKGSSEETPLTARFIRRLPLILDNRVHSIRLHGAWRCGRSVPLADNNDNNHNNCHLCIVSRRRSASDNANLRVVSVSPSIRPRLEVEADMNHVQLDLNHDGESEYFLYLKVSGDGEVFVQIQNLTTTYVIFDVPQVYLARNLRALRYHGALRNELPFHFQLLQAASMALLRQMRQADDDNGDDYLTNRDHDIQQQQRLDVNLVGFLQSSRMDVNRSSLEALVELSSSFLQVGWELLWCHDDLSRRIYDERTPEHAARTQLENPQVRGPTGTRASSSSPSQHSRPPPEPPSRIELMPPSAAGIAQPRTAGRAIIVEEAEANPVFHLEGGENRSDALVARVGRHVLDVVDVDPDSDNSVVLRPAIDDDAIGDLMEPAGGRRRGVEVHVALDNDDDDEPQLPPLPMEAQDVRILSEMRDQVLLEIDDDDEVE